MCLAYTKARNFAVTDQRNPAAHAQTYAVQLKSQTLKVLFFAPLAANSSPALGPA